jgi:cytochrome P450
VTSTSYPAEIDTDDPEALVAALMTPPFAYDPYPVVSRLRQLAPMFRSEMGFWFASDFASCQDVFRSQNVGQGLNMARLEQDPRFATSESLQMFGRMLPFMDPPDHTRIRQLLNPFFSPKAIGGSRPYTQALVDRLLDGMGAKGGGDLVGDFAEHIPVAVVCQLLGGMGDTDQGQCRAWSEMLVEAVHPVCTEEMMEHADAAAHDFSEYFRGLVAKHDGKGDDLMSTLVRAHDEGLIDEDGLLATATTLVGAAYHNTRNHIATGIFTLLQHPAELAKLRADPSLARAATEEVLRYEPPVQLTLPRLALVDVNIGESDVAAGELVCGFLSGAGRDPTRFERPDEFDITRTDGGSLALAHGIHVCIGAAMARMEGEIALRSFFTRFADVELVDHDPVLEESGLPSTRGFKRIEVEIRA